ncbi:MAG: hypothetical protein IPN20_03155 [Haliscomenobacter sp.]|nr:hypothetical protein [Haliscomenobacter sp.]
MNDLIRFYQERHQQHTAKARTLGAAYNRLAVGRLAAFLAGVFLGVFLHPATPPVIAARQEAVRELGRLPDWRHAFRALGMANPSSLRHQEQLQRWLEQAPVFRFRKAMFWTLILLPLLAAAAFAVTLFRGESWWVSATCLLLLRCSPAVTPSAYKASTRQQPARAPCCKPMPRCSGTSKRSGLRAPLLQTLQTAIHTPRISASRALKQLGYLIHQLDVRYNPFAILLNLFGLWDLQWVYRLENWKTEWKPVLAGWFHTLAQFEALSSLGNLHFNHPGWAFPLVETGLDFQSKGLAHPLIPPGRRVGNDLGMPVRAHLKLITGSNMAGKSTFLRSAGVNIVLAQSGAPVCAQAMELPPLQVFTSMRTQDALSENASSFYAELRRLKTLIETAQASQDGPMPVFFLLDEILKGTNSRDRHQGAAALIRQLIRLQSAGLIATHDLELASLEAESQGHIENRYIDVQLQDGQLVFDYQLKKGVSQSFNARRS